jgi:sec-independent protein translocase protein TatA
MGVQELLIVFAILLLFFGAKKLPGLAGSLGTSIKEFRKATESAEDQDERGTSGSSKVERETERERRAERDADPVDRDVER